MVWPPGFERLVDAKDAENDEAELPTEVPKGAFEDEIDTTYTLFIGESFVIRKI